MRIAIVDDIETERALLKMRLERQLSLYGVETEILEFDSSESFLAAEKERHFTVVFLDIYMDGMTGMGLIRWGLTFSMLRKGLFLVCVFVLPPLFGATAVMFSEPISDITAAIVSACGLTYVLPRLLRRQQV